MCNRVMGFVQKAVARLDEKEKLDNLLDELGRAHFYYGAPKKYIEVSCIIILWISCMVADVNCMEID